MLVPGTESRLVTLVKPEQRWTADRECKYFVSQLYLFCLTERLQTDVSKGTNIEQSLLSELVWNSLNLLEPNLEYVPAYLPAL